MSDTNSRDHDDVKRVWKMMEDIHLCMFITHDGDAIRARPMDARVREAENALYFLTDANSHKTDEVSADGSVCLTFVKPGSGNYLAVTGTGRLLNDRVLIRDLWSPAAQAYWDSEDDPNIRVIEVIPQDAQYWDGPGAVAATIALVSAAVMGKRPDLGDNAKVDLH